jgi:hypothetical protein
VCGRASESTIIGLIIPGSATGIVTTFDICRFQGVPALAFTTLLFDLFDFAGKWAFRGLKLAVLGISNPSLKFVSNAISKQQFLEANRLV